VGFIGTGKLGRELLMREAQNHRRYSVAADFVVAKGAADQLRVMRSHLVDRKHALFCCAY
jgi:hypothetical protein